MRFFAGVSLCVALIACASKPPLPPPQQEADAGELLIPMVDAGSPAATVDGSVPVATGDDDDDGDSDDWTPPVCAMPKSTCAALKPKAGSITMERTACYGRCPIYKVTIKSDGTVSWHGEMFVDVQGDRTTTVDAKAVDDLFALLGTSCFSSFKGEYTASVTDHPWAYLTLDVDGHKKVVKHYLAQYREDNPKRTCDAIDKLTRIEKQIDVVAQTRRLVGKGGPKRGR